MQHRAGMSGERLVVVDALRGVAALAVALHHAPRFNGSLSVLAWVQDRGYLGVGLFLVLSGFSIHFTWAASSDLTSFDHRAFWRRRARRLYPAYLGALALSVLIYVAWWGGPFSARRWPLIGVPADAIAAIGALLLPMSNIVPYTYVGVAWTLGLELQLYALYTLFVARLRSIGVLRIVAVAAIVTMGSRLAILLASEHGMIGVRGVPYVLTMVWSWAPPRLLEWVLGMAAAEAYFGRIRLPRVTERGALAIIVLVGGLAIEHVPESARFGGISIHDLFVDPVMGLAFVLALRSLVGLEARRSRLRPLAPLAWLGFFSYSLYLVHIPLERVAARELSAHFAPGRNLSVALAMLAAVLGAYGFHRLAERPFLRRRSHPTRNPWPAIAVDRPSP